MKNFEKRINNFILLPVMKLATLILDSKANVTPPLQRKRAPSYTKSRRKPSFLPLPPPPSRCRSSIKHNSKFSPLTFSIEEVEAFYVTEKKVQGEALNSYKSKVKCPRLNRILHQLYLTLVP